MTESKRTKAERRAKALWDFYNENGVIYLADFKRLTGGQYTQVVGTFQIHGLEYPPVYDSREEVYKRKAQALWDEARQLGQDHLTVKQAAKPLNVRPHEVYGAETKLLKAGLSLPEIRMDEDRGYEQLAESRQISEWAGRLNGVCNPLYHPEGLQVLDCWEGPGENEITYLLR